MTERIADLGFTSDKPEQCGEPPGIHTLAFSPQMWFLLSRVDGKVTLGDLTIISGLNRQETIDTLRKLADAGLIRLPNRTSQPVKPRGQLTSDISSSTRWPVPLEEFVFDPEVVGVESEMPLEMRKLLVYCHYHLQRVSYYDLFNVDRSAPIERIQDSYYRMAKLVHPDRWFRKSIGPMEPLLREVFRWINTAFHTLSSPEQRREYDHILDQGFLGPWDRKKKRLKSKERSASGKGMANDGPNRLALDALLARARKLRTQGALAEASDHYRRALRLAQDRQVSLELAEVLLESNTDLDEALMRVRLTTSTSTSNYAAMMLEARILGAAGRTEESRRLCQLILERDPHNAHALAEMARNTRL